MKRFFAICLCLCLMLCGCNKAPAETTPPTTEPTTVPTTEPTTEPTTVPTEPPVLYRNPLNGAPLEAPFTGRVTTVVLGNTTDALPQHGIANADMLYEVETEGGITRFLAVFSALEDEEMVIMPVRSARTFFNNISQSYDAVIVHCGGSVRGRNAYADRDGSKIEGWQHIDQVYNGKYFARDSDRRSRGVNYEHTLYTNGAWLTEALENKEYNTQEQLDYQLNFQEEIQLSGEAANKIVVHFRGSKTTTFTYNADTGLYSSEQYGRAHIDGNTGEQMTFKNVMALYTDQSFRHDGEYSRSYYELVGEGEGVYATGGQLVKIKWSRASLREPFVYTLEDGSPVPFGIGNTYVAVAGDTAEAVELS